MKKDDCYDFRELAEIHELPPGDPRRGHLADCPRCRARLATYAEFLAAPQAATARQREEALSRLGEALDREIFGDASGASGPRRGGLWRILRLDFSTGALRPAIALAAVLLLLVALDTFRDRSSRHEIVLRSDKPTESAAAIQLNPPRLEADGSIILGWRALADAQSYRVEILDSELGKIASLDAGTDSFLRIDPAAIRDILNGPGAYAWSVIALHEGDELDRSDPATFLVPSGTPRKGAAAPE